MFGATIVTYGGGGATSGVEGGCFANNVGVGVGCDGLDMDGVVFVSGGVRMALGFASDSPTGSDLAGGRSRA